MAKDTDRQRLQQIERTDITESRLNEDLVIWLKTKGPTWLLVVLVAVTVYLGFIRWTQYQSAQINQAWIDLVNADRPESLEEIAETHADVFAVPYLARAEAADAYLRAVISGRDFSDDPALAPLLTDVQRADYLAKADRLYESVVTEASTADDDQDVLLHIVYATMGRAAVAEAKGEIDAARTFYEDAAQRVESRYPALADQARLRAANAEEAATNVFLPALAELPAQGSSAPRTPLEIEESLENLIFPLEAPIIPEAPAGEGSITSDQPEGE